ncbi:MAG: hypothetical protein VXW87_03165 [Pseudomonadota bacterium]|nr:hypothetical protein [Pseudomonadota bacterium]
MQWLYNIVNAASNIASNVSSAGDYSELFTLLDGFFKILDAKNDHQVMDIIGKKTKYHSVFIKDNWERDILSLQEALAGTLKSFSILYTHLRGFTSFNQSVNQQCALSLFSLYLKNPKLSIADTHLKGNFVSVANTQNHDIPTYFSTIATSSTPDVPNDSGHGMFFSGHIQRLSEYLRHFHQQQGQDQPTLYALMQVYKPLGPLATYFLTDNGLGNIENRILPTLLALFCRNEAANASTTTDDIRSRIRRINAYNQNISTPFARALHLMGCIIDPDYARIQSTRSIPRLTTPQEKAEHASRIIREFCDRLLYITDNSLRNINLSTEQKIEFLILTKVSGLSHDLAVSFINKLNSNTQTQGHLAEITACYLAKSPGDYAQKRIASHQFSPEISTGKLADACVTAIYPESNKTKLKRPMQWVKRKIIEFANKAINPFLKLFMVVYLCLSIIAGTFLYIACGMSFLSALGYVTCVAAITLTCQYFLSKYLMKSMMFDLFDNELFHPFDTYSKHGKPTHSSTLSAKAPASKAKPHQKPGLMQFMSSLFPSALLK